jgi:hypothetical protein
MFGASWRAPLPGPPGGDKPQNHHYFLRVCNSPCAVSGKWHPLGNPNPVSIFGKALLQGRQSGRGPQRQAGSGCPLETICFSCLVSVFKLQSFKIAGCCQNCAAADPDPSNWADLAGSQIYHLSFYRFAVGLKNTKCSRMGLRNGFRA